MRQYTRDEGGDRIEGVIVVGIARRCQLEESEGFVAVKHVVEEFRAAVFDGNGSPSPTSPASWFGIRSAVTVKRLCNVLVDLCVETGCDSSEGGEGDKPVIDDGFVLLHDCLRTTSDELSVFSTSHKLSLSPRAEDETVFCKDMGWFVSVVAGEEDAVPANSGWLGEDEGDDASHRVFISVYEGLGVEVEHIVVAARETS